MRAKGKVTSWIGIPPWIILGAVVVLVPIFVFWTLQSITKQKEQTTLLLVEKGAALIRSFEAGTRTGMMGMMGMRAGGFQLQRLLMETAQQSDIVYLMVTDVYGVILAHSDSSMIGKSYGQGLDLPGIARSRSPSWRLAPNPEGGETFEVFRRFSPTRSARIRGPEMMGRRPRPWDRDAEFFGQEAPERIIFVGLDMGPVQAARAEDTRHTVVMALILLLIGFAGIFSLFLAQAYRSTRTSLTRIKAFSDSVVENLPIGLLAVDGKGTVATFNQGAESILGLPSPGILGRRAEDVLPDPLRRLLREMDPEEGALERELDCALQDGRVIPLDALVYRIQGEEGSFWGSVILFRDLTEVRDLKREIERSRRLASLGRLAAGVAHEIRNPLSSIKGFATYFRERYRENPEDRKTADIMIQEVDRLNRVISQLLEFARPMELVKRPLSVQTVIQHALRMVEGQARDEGVEIQTHLPPDAVEVSADADKLQQVFLNLYLNAIQAMEGGGELSVDLSGETDSGRIRIRIRDTGSGIVKEDLVHVFDPYFTTKQSGTGLGLAIVHRIIEAHNGEIRIESEPGEGTEVTILLPVFS
ncbi:MAG: PAS domain-containing protein [Deltaproteobacteria bacterium]|nr:PAS domain-containing protein [Deltaproteobacteria bacterium]